MRLKRSITFVSAALALLSLAAGWYSWERGQQPRQAAQETASTGDGHKFIKVVVDKNVEPWTVVELQ